jgi:hypothetical protein
MLSNYRIESDQSDWWYVVNNHTGAVIWTATTRRWAEHVAVILEQDHHIIDPLTRARRECDEASNGTGNYSPFPST